MKLKYFCTEHGSFTFEKGRSITQQGDQFISTVFALSEAGVLELHITRGTVMKNDGVVEIKELTEKDVSEEFLAAFEAELAQECARLCEDGASERSVVEKTPLSEVVNPSKLPDDAKDLGI